MEEEKVTNLFVKHEIRDSSIVQKQKGKETKYSWDNTTIKAPYEYNAESITFKRSNGKAVRNISGAVWKKII